MQRCNFAGGHALPLSHACDPCVIVERNRKHFCSSVNAFVPILCPLAVLKEHKPILMKVKVWQALD